MASLQFIIFGLDMEARSPQVKRRKYRWILLVLLIAALLIKIISLYPEWIESYYSMNVYVLIGKIYRALFGWLPLSFGDLLYTCIVIYLVWKVGRLLLAIYKRRLNKERGTLFLKNAAIAFGSVYIIFNLNWGLNYNRLGIGHQLKITPKEHTREDLTRVTALLVQKVNEARKEVGDIIKYPSYQQMFLKAVVAYNHSAKKYSFLHYENTSVKRSLFGRGGNYFGFLGYFNPFTGESQLNLTQPRFLIPFVTCHEMAHQVGYANETEANFVGYLTAIESPDPLFHYSAYFDLFRYANAEMAKRDSVKAKENYNALDNSVKRDFTELKLFYKKYKNPVEPIIWIFYDKYLKANQQEKGVESYNQVVGLLIAYLKQYGKI
jgi:hypothetical protein